jgi:Uma2 family endonuclease
VDAPVIETQLITCDEFEDILALPENRERTLELIDGIIVEKAMPTDEHSIINSILNYHLFGHSQTHGLGLPGAERRFRAPGDPYNTRVPNPSLILDVNIPIVTKGAIAHPPDLIAEVKSTDDSIEGMRARAKWYVDNGVRLVWLVFPRQRIVEVYGPGQDIEILTIEDALDGYDVLPGFTLAVAKLFPQTRAG